ncbi:21130_t:CDS:2, partial [Cetraspora pellucida]
YISFTIMGRKEYNFQEFFQLAKPDNPKANKKASHLRNCPNFKAKYSTNEVSKIFARPVPEDLVCTVYDINYLLNKSVVTDIESVSEDETITSSTISKTNSSLTKNFVSKKQNQKSITSFVLHSMFSKDKGHLENLILHMIVSNGLSFTFMENQETQDLTEKILQDICADKIGVIAVFDGWMNIKQKHLFGITENVKILIKNIMDDANLKGIKINCFVSDSASDKRKHSEVEKNEQQYKQIHIITSIQPFNEDVTQNELTEPFLLKSNNKENNLLVSNNLSIQLSEITEMNNKDVVDDIEENWSHTIKNLISSLDSENCLDNSNVVDSKLLEFELHRHIIHLVDDPSAKWCLLELFDNLLEALISFVH